MVMLFENFQFPRLWTELKDEVIVVKSKGLIGYQLLPSRLVYDSLSRQILVKLAVLLTIYNMLGSWWRFILIVRGVI